MLNKNFINNLNFNNTDKKFILMIFFITLGLILQAGAGSWDTTVSIIKKTRYFFLLRLIF